MQQVDLMGITIKSLAEIEKEVSMGEAVRHGDCEDIFFGRGGGGASLSAGDAGRLRIELASSRTRTRPSHKNGPRYGDGRLISRLLGV